MSHMPGNTELRINAYPVGGYPTVHRGVMEGSDLAKLIQLNNQKRRVVTRRKRTKDSYFTIGAC